ncbi:MAG TPA: hypothetical protein VFE58_17075, partial [Tepidisphaeraceae bacterium]|nr:hypothetical protein [Tepidisphaeraceae bacterium]
MHQGSSVEAIKTAGVGDGMIDAATAKQTEGMGAVLGFVDRYRKVLLGLVLVIYLAGFNGVWRPEPDSALYMTIGRNLAEGKGYTYLGKVDGLAYPGFPYFLAGVFKVFGAGSLFVPHLLVWLMGLATLGLTYAYFRQHESRAMAVLVTVNCGVAQTLYLCALQLRNDVPFLMGVMGFLTGYEAILRRSRRKEVRVG